jgi:5-oxoprolinase (ATP-hydrolysing) subunit A
MSARDIECMIAYQIGALSAIAAGAGTTVTHVKPHGALSNMAHVDPEYAGAIARAIKSVDRDLIFVAIACSEMVTAGRKEGLRVAEEAFCDRTYDDTGKLTSRKFPDALIRDPEQAVRQVVSFINEQAVITRTGKKLPAHIQTFCTHGDEPTGPGVASAVREALEKSGIRVVPLPELTF